MSYLLNTLKRDVARRDHRIPGLEDPSKRVISNFSGNQVNRPSRKRTIF
jgi:hypothetical protein